MNAMARIVGSGVRAAREADRAVRISAGGTLVGLDLPDASATGILRRILEQHVLCAMAHRLRVVHERLTKQDLTAALEDLTVAHVVIDVSRKIQRATPNIIDLLGVAPASVDQLQRLLPPVRKWIGHLSGAPLHKGAAWEEGAPVRVNDKEVHVFGLRLQNPPLLYVFLDVRDETTAVRAAARAFRLTPREEEILQLIIGGLPNTRIASNLHLSVDTVKLHVSRLLKKFGVQRRVHLVRRVLSTPHHIAPLSPLAPAPTHERRAPSKD